MENNLVNVEQFLERRPDMEVHTDVSIQSAINSAYILLDGECAGLISLVDKYMSGSDIDTKNDLYRNTFEMTQLKEAIIFQTQYILNMGNDFSVGGGSYSIGNVNGSFNRPEGREAVAPGVYKLLSNARVYNLNYGIGIKTNDNSGCCERMDDAPISQESADLRYVRVQQQEAEVGSVAYVNQSNQVAFGNPQDLNITSYNTNRIEGGVGHKGNYYEIDNVPNIAFFGKDLNGTYSAVHRGEIQDILDNWIESIDIHILDGLTKQEIYDAIVAAGGVWSPLIKYSQGFIVIFPLDNVNAKKVKSTSGFYGFAKSLQNNNLNNDPNNSPDYWEILPATPTDLVALQEYIKDYIDNTILPILQNETIPNEVANQIAQEKADLIKFTKGTYFSFGVGGKDYFNQVNGTTDDDWELVPIDGNQDDGANAKFMGNTLIVRDNDSNFFSFAYLDSEDLFKIIFMTSQTSQEFYLPKEFSTSEISSLTTDDFTEFDISFKNKETNDEIQLFRNQTNDSQITIFTKKNNQIVGNYQLAQQGSVEALSEKVGQLETKQDKLTAGNGISIENNVISLSQDKINVLFGWEPNTNRNYYVENNYNISLPSQVLDTSKNFMCIAYFGSKNDPNNWNCTIDFNYKYNVSDKYRQSIEIQGLVNIDNTHKGQKTGFTLYQGKLVRVDSWQSSNNDVLYGIRFIEI